MLTCGKKHILHFHENEFLIPYSLYFIDLSDSNASGSSNTKPAKQI